MYDEETTMRHDNADLLRMTSFALAVNLTANLTKSHELVTILSQSVKKR